MNRKPKSLKAGVHRSAEEQAKREIAEAIDYADRAVHQILVELGEYFRTGREEYVQRLISRIKQ
jgi:hypothetical protein